ncbi:HSPB1-associated protein 1 isoform X6 [Lemur catta]|uniref:HSPB1-associated protein 1 isoform X6 n=1 Tax=Lemur catta TaxID=9447 RepID=UPI001E26B9F0|nr:HSPB1-associated protein 1 isoform X6 [Lemur catta]
MAAGSGTTTHLTPATGAGWEEGEHVKPFTPEKAKEIIMSLQQPAIFCNMVFDWPSRHWNAKHLSEILHGKQIRFRMGMKSIGTGRTIIPQFETTCSYVEATLEEFLTWNCDQSSLSGPFRDYDHSKFWAYADYKYFVSLFEDKTDIFQDVRWSDFGFPGRNGQESTLWIGSLGSHTPCHLDSYGCNLVFQVLFVPRHWWHYVESIDPVTVSINSWIELEEDHLARVEEAITRMLVCALKTAEDPHNTRAWLNPTEVEETSHEVNCRYLNGAVSAFFDHYRASKVVEIQALKTNREHTEEEELNVYNYMGQTCSQNLTMGAVKQEAASTFGPDLVPVTQRSEEPPSGRGGILKSDGKDFVDKDGEHFGKSHCAKRQQMQLHSENAAVGQVASNSTVAPSQTFISTDDVLDCLVNPQVTRTVAQLLIQGRSL